MRDLQELSDEIINTAMVTIYNHLEPGSKLCLVAYKPGNPKADFLRVDSQFDMNEAVSVMRRKGLSIDGDNAYKRDLCDSIVGTLAFGAQDRCPPPEGHWAQRFWDMGRESSANTEGLISALELVTDCLSKALTGGEVSAARAGSALTTAAELLAKQSR
jgi:hypothetical protein